MGNWWEKPCIFLGVGDTIGWESYGKKYPYFGESIGTNFTVSLNSMDFAAFSNAMGNWWGNLSISHVICDEVYFRMGIWLGKCTHAYYGKSMTTNIPGFPPQFSYIFPCRKLMGQPMHFSYADTTEWESNEKKSPYYGKSMGTNFPGFDHLMVFAEFSHATGNWFKNLYVPCNEEYDRMGI